MKTKILIINALLILIIGCEQKRNNPIVKPDSKVEITEKKAKVDLIFRDIIELEEYKGFEKMSGQVLSGTDLVLEYIQKDSLKVLILEKIVKNSTPKPNYSVLDKVSFISENSDQYIALTRCDFIENSDEKIIFSLVKDEDTEYFDKILKTWIIDLNENKFKEIETEKVKCFNEWYGYDG